MSAEGRNILEAVLNTNIAKKFDEVDNAVSKLQTTFVNATSAANNFAAAMQNITNAFSAASTGDFAAKINSLVESMTKLNTVGNNAAGLTTTQQGIEGIGLSATQNVELVNRLVEAINKLPESFNNVGKSAIKTNGSGKTMLDSLLFDTSELEAKKAKFAETLANLEAQIKAMHPRYQAALSNSFKVRMEIEDVAREEIIKYQQQINQLGFEIQKIGLLNRENFNPKDVEGYIAAIEQIKQRIKEVEATRDALTSSDFKQDPLIQSLNRQYDELYEKIRKTIEERKGVEVELSQHNAKNSQIQQRIKEIDELKEKLVSLNKQFEELKLNNNAFDSKGNLSDAAKSIVREKQEIEEKIKLYQMSADEAVKYQQKIEDETRKRIESEEREEKQKIVEIQKLYAERLELEKKVANTETRKQQKELLGVDSSKETELIRKYNEQIEESKRKIDDLRKRYPELVEAAQKAYDTKAIENQITAEDKRTSAIARTVKQVDALAAAKEKEERKQLGITKEPQTVEEYRIAIRNLTNEIRNMKIGDKDGISQIQEKIKRYSKELENGVQSVKKFNEENKKLGITLRDVASTFGVYIGLQSLTNLVRKVREVTGEFELQHRALQAIIQDTQAANQIWDKTIKLAVRSPYNVKQLVTYTKQLAAYRVESDKLYDTTKMLADISSGLGVDMQRLILAYGQVKAANYLRGQELRQFSEAGINILGELAKYFTELKGQAVSTGQVFEMVSKRMVKFEDVAEVLHRLTEEGGAFYKMQEIQAETLSGIYTNLKDRVDLALNSMGQDTRGVLVGLAKAATYLLENWRAFSNMLTSGMIIWGFYKLEVLRAARAKGAFTAATIQATAAEGGFIGMLAKSKLALKAFATSIKTIFTTGLGIAGVIIAAITAIGTALWNHHKRIEESKKKYEELNQGINKNGISGFNKLSDAISENNRKIKENIRLRDEAKESGNKEKEIQLQAEINQLQEKNNKLVDDVKSKYRELSEEIETTADGIVEIGNGAKELAHIQTMTSDITNLFGENAGKKNDITDTTKDLELAFNELDLATSQFNTQFTYWMNNVERELKESTKLSDEFKNSVQGIIDNEALSNLQKYQMIQARVEKSYGGMIKVLGKIDRDYITSLTSAQSKVNSLTSSISVEIERVSEKLKEMYDIADDKKSAEKASEGFIKNLGFIKGKVSEFLQGMFSEKLDIKVKITPNDEKKELLEWQDKVNEFIQKTVGSKNRETTIPISAEITNADETRDAYRKMVKGLIDDAEEIIRVFEKAKKEGTEQLIYTVDEYNNAVSKLPDLKALYDAVGGEYEKKGANPALELLNKQISAIKEAQQQYEKYLKLFDKKTAFNKVKNEFSGLFSELGLTDYVAGLNDFDGNTVKNAFKDKLQPSVEAAGKQGRIAAEKFYTEFQYGVDKNAFDKFVKDFNDGMDKAMNQYDMFKELEKLGIGGDISEAIFGISTKSIGQLKREFDRQKQILLEKYNGDDALKAIESIEKKISALEDKERVERLKKYTEYLIKGRNEAVKIYLDQLTKMAEIDELHNVYGYWNETQYKAIADAIKKETQAALDKNAWEEFKGSDFYTVMFEDISHIADSSLELMYQKLQQLRSSLNELEPTQVKEIVQQIDKIDKERHDRHPFRYLIQDIQTLRNWNKKGNATLLEQLMGDESDKERIRKELSLQVAELQAEYNKLSKDEIEGNEGEVQQQLEEAQRKLKKAEEELEQIRQRIGEINSENIKGQTAFDNILKTIQTSADYFKQMAEAAGTVTTEVMDMMDGVDDASKQLAKDIAEIAVNTAILVSDIAKAIASEGTDVASMIDGVIRTWYIIKGIVSASEASANRIIDEQSDRLEQLEWNYERVKRASDMAWDVQAMREYNNELNKYLNDQIAAYDEMIKAEESRKSPDKDLLAEYKRSRIELYEQLEDETSDFLESVGGIGVENYGEVAQGFVDAWFEAFNETGDGLEGLEKHFDEFVQNVIKRQALVRLANQMLEPLFKDLDKYLQDGILSTAEYNKFVTDVQNALPQFNEVLKQFAYSFGLFGDQAEGTLTGLQKGIQGVTEETAEIIAAYMNSIRYYVIDTNTKLGQIISALQDSTGAFNPMVAELQNIRQQTEDIKTLLYGWRETSGTPSMRVTIVG